MKAGVAKPIYSISPFTLLDYPDKTACILWFAGCNMRCLYCYNPSIVLGKGKIRFEEALTFLRSRMKLLDGVVLSGGECTMHKNLIDFIIEIKKLGLLVKIDTNGSNPDFLKHVINENLIDYVALDFKAPKAKFQNITHSDLYKDFTSSLNLLAHCHLPFEVRTTFHSSLLDSKDLQEMVHVLENLNYTGSYFIQHYMNDTETLTKLENSERAQFNASALSTKLKVVVRN
jgi:pyruvate formate lyase activating enzyme